MIIIFTCLEGDPDHMHPLWNQILPAPSAWAIFDFRSGDIVWCLQATQYYINIIMFKLIIPTLILTFIFVRYWKSQERRILSSWQALTTTERSMTSQNSHHSMKLKVTYAVVTPPDSASTAWNWNSFFELPNFLRFWPISLNSRSKPKCLNSV